MTEVVYRFEFEALDEFNRLRRIVEYIAGSDALYDTIEEAQELACTRLALRKLSIVDCVKADAGRWEILSSGKADVSTEQRTCDWCGDALTGEPRRYCDWVCEDADDDDNGTSRSSEECPSCGYHWHPSMYASETYPGSRCDMGECWCIYCGEDGCDSDCPRLQRRQARKVEEAKKEERR